MIEATTLGDLVDRAASMSDGDALVFPDVRVSFPELSRSTTRVARALRALGVGPGDKVGILMPDCLDNALGLFAAAKLGAVVVPINGRYKARELDYVITHADVRVLLTAAGPAGTADFPALVAEVFPEVEDGDASALAIGRAPALRQIVNLSGERAGMLGRPCFEAGAASVAEAEVGRLQERVRIRDVALLMYTSGTTARPKGCLLTHEALVRHGFNVARSRFFLSTEDVYWDPLPLFHCGGIVPMLSCLSVPCTFCHAGHFDPDVALEMLERERVSVAYPAFETIWLAVLNHPRFAEADLSRMRLIQNIAVPERLQQMHEAMPWVAQVSSYGATECASNLTLPLPDDPIEVRHNTLGTPVPGMELKIVDPATGLECPAGEPGEICFRGYARFEAYYKEPELSASAIDAEGWFHSGDLGAVDEAGRLVYTGRLKDVIKVGGENVSALEVEDYLLRHRAVEIAQVVGAPDARYVEVPAAYVQLRAGTSATEDELIDFCAGKIATFKVPRYVRFVEEWPMSATKIQKFVLRDRIATELAEKGIIEAPRISSRTSPGPSPA